MDHWFIGEDRTFDLRDGLTGVRCPVLVVTGDTDPVVPVEMAEEIVVCLPQSAALAVVPAPVTVFSVISPKSLPPSSDAGCSRIRRHLAARRS